MKTAKEILEEAPVSARYKSKLAFICSRCAWWTNSWEKPRSDDKGLLHCKSCDSPMITMPLGLFIESTQNANPEHFGGFLRNFSDNYETDKPGFIKPPDEHQIPNKDP